MPSTAITLGKISKTKTAKRNVNNRKKANSFEVWLTLHQALLTKIGVAVLILGLFAVGIWRLDNAYQGKILPKVMIAGLKVGGKTPLEAQAILSAKTKELNDQGPKISYNDQTLKPKLDQMGITFNLEEMVQEAANYGRKGTLEEKIKANFNLFTKGYTLEIKPVINEEKFDAFLGSLATVVEKEPVNASLAVQNGQVLLSPSQKGRGLDKDKLKTDLTNLINSGQTSGQITLVTSDLEPKIGEEGTADAKTQAEKLMNAAPITVTFENSSWTVDRAEIGSWIKFSENSDNLAVSTHPNAFVNWVAGQVEIAAEDREIEEGTGTVLKEGQDGRGVDSSLLLAQIREALNQGQPGTFALATFAIPRGQKTINPHAQPGRFAGRYIDINLSEQTLYAFEGPTLVRQFLVSTGRSGYATPTGEYSVWGKTRSQTMDGPGYYLPNVQWISWFNGEIAIHGTYWHNNFGTPMSHGCINASEGDAEWVYNWDDIGTPVYVHY